MFTFLVTAAVVIGVPAQIRRPEAAPALTGIIEGQVRDSAGTSLSGFSVVATQQQTANRFGAVTGEAGEFRIEGVPAGIYDLTVARAGFPEVLVPGISVTPNSRNLVNPEIPIRDTSPPAFRRPGAASPGETEEPVPIVTTPEPNAVRRPLSSGVEIGAPPAGSRNAEEDFIAIRNRFDIELPPWKRYPSGPSDVPYVRGPSASPYKQNRFKGDYPVFGKRWFLDLSAASDTFAEGRRLPVPGPASSQRAGTPDFFSEGEQLQLSENVVLTADLFHGLTSFKPVDFRLRLTPVLNGNYLAARETGLVNIDVRERNTRLDYQVAGIQEGFAELRMPVTSPNFDFVSVRLGTQTFNSDFRGFIFFDSEPGIRVFGNLRSNRIQYNAAYFYMMEKDTNSLLNTLKRRNQDVLIGNLYMQDFIKPGYTAELSVHYNRDKPGFHIDKNGFLARPAPIGTVVPKAVNAIYAGWAGDGHFGRTNITHALYQVLGRERPSPISGDVFGPLTGKINAQMAAVEVSFDQDWRRYRLSAFYASGDSNPSDNQSRGFDSIFDNVQFAGGDISFWNRQGIRLSGTGVGLNQRFSLQPALRTSKEEGQANFVNPGLYLLNAGMDAELTPKLRASTNLNLLSFAHTQVLETLLFQSHISRNIGVDAGMGFRWRPLLNDNVIIKFGGAALIPAIGFRQIYTSKTLFSTFTELRLAY